MKETRILKVTVTGKSKRAINEQFALMGAFFNVKTERMYGFPALKGRRYDCIFFDEVKGAK